MFTFSRWPPTLNDSQVDDLTRLATTYALSHGLLYLPPNPSLTPQDPSPTSAIHAPLSLIPSPIPRDTFFLAKRLQHAYNTLYARVAMDDPFLDRVMGAMEGVGRADEFVGTLWKGWKEVREEGIAQPLQLGLFRSDYLLHAPGDGVPVLKQVEFNTISASFGALSERAAAMHRYIMASTHYYDISPQLVADNLPPNTTTAGLAQGLAEAHKAYGVSSARILFVIQPGERNIFDQRWLEYELLERHSIHVVRQTFDDLTQTLSIHPTTRVLNITLPSSPDQAALTSTIEISTIYFRAGYVPSDFLTAAHYSTRIALERSLAIKCPSIPLQLAGGKKVQEALTRDGILEGYLSEEETASVDEVRGTWMGMWALDDTFPPPLSSHAFPLPTSTEPAGTSLARAHHSHLVLKPQREGGGNNVYTSSIPSFLDSLPPSEREAWIAMEMIETPDVGGYLVRAGGGRGSEVRAEVVSELGIFGWALFGGGKVNREEEVGWLMRTKGRESNEGGVAAGFSVLDSVLLV